MSISEEQLKTAIREILKGADLSNLSSKKVREKLEEKFNTDLAARKQQVDDILMNIVNEGDEDDEEFENGNADTSYNLEPQSSAKNNHASGTSVKHKVADDSSYSSNESSGGSDDELVDREPVRKKPRNVPSTSAGRRSSSPDQADDNALTKRLHQEELGLRPRKVPEAKSKKNSNRPRRPPKLCVLSEELSSVVGADRMSRVDVVKKMWEIIRERNMTDPKQKQFIICDAQFERLFKKKRVKAFGMMKVLKNHCKEAHLVAK